MFGQWQVQIPESQECEIKDKITTEDVTKYSSNSVTKEDTQTEQPKAAKMTALLKRRVVWKYFGYFKS